MSKSGTHRVIRRRGIRIDAEGYEVIPDALAALKHELRQAIAGDVRDDKAELAAYMTDASNYRQVPLAIVKPLHAEDAVKAIEICAKYDIPVTPRGGGTSLAGQTCNTAVQIDFSKYMDKVLSLDPEQKLAWVEPGCVLDTLRLQAEEYNLTFGPDPSTHDHNSLGGMIGNNSCGVHSVMAGRTADNVHKLDIVTYDGLRMTVGPTPPDELERIIAAGGRRSQIYRDLRDFFNEYGHLFEERYPQIPRRVSGYANIDQLDPKNGFNVARAIVGTEANLAMVLKAEVNLVHSPPCRILGIVGFPDIFLAGDHAAEMRNYGAIAIEGIDHLLVEYMERKHFKVRDLEVLPEGKGWLICEFGGDTEEEALARARPMIAKMKAKGFPSKIVTDKETRAEVWDVREAALGATAHVPGTGSTWPGWEDSAVHPKDLGNYLRELKALFHEHGYEASVYGHFGDGLVHCRVDFDLATESGLDNWRAFLDEAADLVIRYNGSLSGEHGDGQARGQLLKKMYGPELMEAHRKFRAIWDPRERMNPGKKVSPYPISANLRYGPGYSPEQVRGLYAYPEDGGSFTRASIRCVGVGKCRRPSPQGGVMCPSYQATREEMHSTRGRARILNEMLRGETIPERWQSEAVEEALNLCLACKGCKKDCPVGVDMAAYKSEFRARHYADKLRPRTAYSMGRIQMWARVAGYAPWLANFCIQTPGLSDIVKYAAGISVHRRMPPFSDPTFRRWHRRRRRRNVGGRRVILWADTFNNFFRAGTAKAATHLLEDLGFRVSVPRQTLCCGRPLYDWGWIGQAKALWRDTMNALADDIHAGTPIVGLEPSCMSAFKDELIALFPDDPMAKQLSQQTMILSEFLEQQKILVAVDPASDLSGYRAIVQFHCHHHSVLGKHPEQALIRRLPLKPDFLDAGCCGMAGPFGFEADKYELAMKIGDLGVLPPIRRAGPQSIVIADGFACREQIEQSTGRKTLHLAQLLAGSR